MTLKTLGLATAGMGAAAAFGLLKWSVLRGGRAWWAIALGVGLLVLSTPAQGEAEG